jgi:redox-sensing transcriptional repressor
MERLKEIIEREKAQIAIIAVPAEYAQDVADQLAGTNIQGILNFAPRVLNVPEHIELRNVDLSVNLELLTFNLALRRSMKGVR